MAKMRVYQLANELQVQSALILELLDRMGREVKSDLSMLDQETTELVRRRITSAIAAAKKRMAEEQRKQASAPRSVRAPARPARPAAEPETVAEPEPAPTASASESAPASAPEAPAPAAPAASPAPEAPAEIAAKSEERPEPPRSDAPRVAPTPSGPTPGPRVGTTTPANPPLPGQRKPRVFPARRLTPHPSVKAAAARAERAAAGLRPEPPRPPQSARPGVRPPHPPGMRPPMGQPQHRPGGPLPPRKRRKKEKERSQVTPVAAKPKPDLPPVPESITLSEAVTVKELAEKLNRKSKDVIGKLIARGVLANINQPLDPEVAIDVAKEFGSEAKVISFEEEVQQADGPIDEAPVDTGVVIEERPEDIRNRPPVVTVMGHVDHGKTSLLDAIRAADVAEGEAGGITQHIGAYQVVENGRKITFLDTPGHEAFTLMRARGSRVTDIVVLVVAADDGVKPQTIEAIDHARAADVPIVVAINKIDKANAQPDRVKQQLTEHELVIEEYGGDVVSCEISAKQKTGIDSLLEMILLVADMRELSSNEKRPGTGVVLETRLDRARGIVSTVLVQDGTMRVGDPFIAGAVSGKVRALNDEHGQRVDSAGPATPVEVIGFSEEPSAGDAFQVVADEAKARQIASFRAEKIRAEAQRKSARRTLESLSRDVAAGEVKELPVIIKADSQGSSEALQKSLSELPQDKIRVNVVRASIGAVTRADVLLASASNAIVVGFNVRPDRATAELAKQEEVEVRMYSVIYDLLNDVKQAMVGLLEPTFREEVLGQAEVRQTFKVPKIGVIAGCYVTDGKVVRNAEVRLLRDNVVIYTGKVGSLKRFKDDVSEVKNGYECGIGIANYNDLKEGDVIEFFVMQKVAPQSL